MKTTLNIDDTVMAELKREAARQGRTISELVETALHLLLRSRRKREKIAALPSLRGSGDQRRYCRLPLGGTMAPMNDRHLRRLHRHQLILRLSARNGGSALSGPMARPVQSMSRLSITIR